MSSVEDRKKERIKKVLDAILDSNPITAISEIETLKTKVTALESG